MEPALGATAGMRGIVLVCDDTESIRRLLRINLELDGFEVSEACDGEDAVARLRAMVRARRLPHVVVLDAQMTPRDGWWALEQIRACPALHAVPVVMATAENEEVDRTSMVGLGLDACVAKPFDVDEVVEIVDGFVREGRAHQPPGC